MLARSPSFSRLPTIALLAALLIPCGSVPVFGAAAGETGGEVGEVGAVGAVGKEKPPTPIETLKRDLLGIQKNLTSLSFRIRHGMSGVGGESGGSGRQTPGLACCASNLERIDTKMRSMRKMLERLDIHYAGRNDSEALAVLDRVRAEMNIVARGLAVFAMAESQARAVDAQLGVIRPFNRLRDAITALESCCPVEGRLPEAGGGS